MPRKLQGLASGSRQPSRTSHAKIYWPTGLVPRLFFDSDRPRKELAGKHLSRAKALLLQLGIPLSPFAEAH